MTLAVDELAWSTTETTACLGTSPSSWTATAAGPASAGLPRAEGHRQGVEAVRRTVKAALELGITYLTLFSFSSENWSRPKQEIHDLFGLMRRFVRRDLAELHQNGVKIRIIGTRIGLDDDILRLIDDAAALTKDNTRAQPHHRLQLRLPRRDRPRRRAPRRGGCRTGRSTPQEITPERFGAYLDTAGMPDPDLLIRTSGELRL